MKRLFFALALILLLVSSAFALSDKEYTSMKRSSPEFARADRELSRVWNDLKDILSGREFDKLRKEQRQWVAKGRDRTAKKYIDEGYSRVEAYTEATLERVEELKEYY